MIKVHKYGPAFGLPDASPFVTKVETYLRLAGVPYEVVPSDVRKAPRKQLPCAEIDGVVIPDSSAIVETVEGKQATKLDAHLDDKQRAVAYAFKSMLEEYLYFGVLYMRWATDDGWAVFEPHLRGMLGSLGVPGLLKGRVSKQARKSVIGRSSSQGIGRKPRAEIVATCKKMIDATATQLGDGPYFCGDKPTTYDATVYAFVASVLCPAFDNELYKHARAQPNLVAYHDRIKSQYWTKDDLPG